MRSLSHNRSSYFRFTQVRYAGRFEYALKELSG